MIVYRVETYDRTGVYRSEYDTYACIGPMHPDPTKDGLEDFTYHYIFGFKSIAQLRRWFNDDVRSGWATEMETIANDNEDSRLYVSVYDVPAGDVMFGGSQLIFIKKAAKLLYRKAIDTLEDDFLVA